MYIGHKSDDGRIQALKEHLEGVASRAGAFAAPFFGQAHAQRTGILHDAGKYSEAGQKRMNDPKNTAKVDHATAGARIAQAQLRDAYGAVAIAGHHGGMPDLGNKLSGEGDGTLCGRIQKDLSGKLDASAFWQENKIEKDGGVVFPEWLQKEHIPFSHQFYTRMLFSCLVDADFLDTEAFMKKGEKPEELRGHYVALKDLKPRFDQSIAELKEKSKKAKKEINGKRNEILNDCLEAGAGKPGLYSLTVPTGGGKTISSLAFAMAHAKQNDMKRIIYVIPYTSIIEQNAKVFREILGDENVIEHHSGIQVDEDEKNTMEENEVLRRKMLATENWDAPVIVTTAVQFFDSLFSNKPSKCRKLHNIADSVIIFDEAQMIPLAYLKPCVCAIGELVRHYHATAVLCTATQPSLNRMFSEYDKNLTVHEICHDVAELQMFFRRVRFEDAGQMDLDGVTEAMTRQNQVLCIVNKKKSAQELFYKLPKEGGASRAVARLSHPPRGEWIEICSSPRAWYVASGLTPRGVSGLKLEGGAEIPPAFCLIPGVSESKLNRLRKVADEKRRGQIYCVDFGCAFCHRFCHCQGTGKLYNERSVSFLPKGFTRGMSE